MTDIRAALEELLNQWDAEAGAMPDSRVRTVLQSCAMEVRAILLDPVIARAALAAASPEPERLGDPTCPETHVDGRCIRCGDLTQPAPAAPSVEALRDALLDDLTEFLDKQGWHPYTALSTQGMVKDRLDAFEAAVRADERARLDVEALAVDAGPEPRHMPVICCRWHAIAGQPR